MRYRIWSFEHEAWWRPNAHGYTPDIEQAGIFFSDDAHMAVMRANVNGQTNEALVPVMQVFEPEAA